ncbi:hypothetical protein AX17_001804 [Amanita inopinata Kibby_2008]|nr:hypothetical protein AX17_001804 [Amanita inopinata Kibby_2008]
MKRVFQILALFSAVCSACRPSRRGEVVTFSSGGNTSVGAAYFMSNDPSGNYLFTTSIECNSTVVLRKAYYTKGAGGHVISQLPDALFSQGSIITSKLNNLVILVNAGSNTLSVFRIDRENPTNLVMVGKPVPSGGDFPNSVALNNAENVLCALNTGKVNNINCFTVDARRGLSPLPNTTRSLGLPQSNPPTAPTNTGSQLAFTPDDQQLIVSVKGVPNPGRMSIYDVAADGSLSEQPRTMYGGQATWSITFIPGKNAILSADPFVGYDIFDLDAFAANSSMQAAEFKVDSQQAICWSERSPKTGHYYLSDSGRGTIYEVEIDQDLSSRVVNIYAADKYDGLVDLRITSLPDQPDHLYVLAGNTTSIEVFTLIAPGQAQRIQKLDIGGPAAQAGVALSPANAFGMATWLK